MAGPRRTSVSHFHRTIALAAMAAVLGVCGWALLRSRNAPAAPALQTGDYWPRAVWEAMELDEVDGNIHLVLFSPGCRWCDLQLSSLEKLLAEPGDDVRTLIVVVAGFHEATLKLSDSPLRRNVAFVPRARLQPEIGIFVTPTHVILNGDRRVLTVHAGYLTRERLRTLRAEAVHRFGGPKEARGR